jgi:ATP-dependent exoDNAse (exonuclease V) beta subunit
MEYLAKLHPHARDSRISFEEGPHIYTIDGNRDFMSVTKWNHSHFPHFNAQKIINKMMNSPKWPQSKYFGLSVEEIKTQWSENGRQASEAGTKMHYDIECFYNNMEVDNDSVEYAYFTYFYKDHHYLKPFRTEWMIWDKELRFAGSIDMTFQREDGTIDIYDWKRCKDIKKSNQWESATTRCIDYLPNTNFWHYSLQLNTYKALLEKNYGVKVGDMYLVCLHPNKDNYIKMRCADLTDEVQMLFELRRKMLNITRLKNI